MIRFFHLSWLSVFLAAFPVGAQADPPEPAADGLPPFVPSAELLSGEGRGDASVGRVYQARIVPHWGPGDTHFWYRNDLPAGGHAYVLVDCEAGTREEAFDLAALARSLAAAGAPPRGDHPRLESLRFDERAESAYFRYGGKTWRLRRATGELAEVEGDGPAPAPVATAAPLRSENGGAETQLTVRNRTAGDLALWWLDTAGRPRSYGTVAAGETRSQRTYAGHVWEIVDDQGRALARVEATRAARTVEVTADAQADAPPAVASQRAAARRADRSVSPDGRWKSEIRDHNLYLLSTDGAKEWVLTHDGSPGHAYVAPVWSPDSKALVALRRRTAERRETHLIESSPNEGGRAKLHSRPYPLPGDPFDQYEWYLFRPSDRTHMVPDVEPVDLGRPRLRWRGGGHRFTYEKVDRGHQRYRLIEVDAVTGQSRTLIDEQADTFIWTAHAEHRGVARLHWLEATDELIFVSERDGWRHLYLVDLEQGKIASQITRGPFVIRGIDRIDESKREIWFRASGKEPGQDPYFVHSYRIRFDGTSLVRMTEGNGTHTVQFSPRFQYLVDTYSRVDRPPVHTLRRTCDGELICGLETADISELESAGWQPPEVFVAKGRDGETDIWGVIYRPDNFNPRRRYPVIEHIYAGPHDFHSPKRFQARHRFAALRQRGFFVVQMDGMGTAHRSKSFHDVCWQNLKDAGLPDRILWHQAAAAAYPQYDTQRLGIYGVSAGGQNAAAALLFHDDVYKAGVAACGCHDNRMDKASWNEQWLGYPVGPQYAANSNIEHAHRLRGALLLIVGEMDRNVPPESTIRFADALIQAGKDFELVVVPGAGHGLGGAYGRRRMQDFFVRQLHRVEPPDRNAPPAIR